MVSDEKSEGVPSRRERRRSATRQRLLEVALQLFCERGFEATTVEDITEAADVAKSTFFNYFETKEAILPALAEWRLSLIEQAIQPEEGAPLSPVARIKCILSLLAQDPVSDQLLAQRLASAAMPRNHPLCARQALIRLLTEQIRQAQAAGEMRADFDPAYLGGMIRAMFFHHMVLWHFGDRSVPLAASLERMVDLFLDGAAGPSWRAGR